MENKIRKLHVKIIFLWIGCFCALVLGGVGAYMLDQKMEETIINTYAIQQKDAVDRTVRHMKEAYEVRQPKDADALFTAYIQEETSSAGAYWFLYTEDHILFEKDAMQTKMQDGKTLNQMIEEWRSKGGWNVDRIPFLFKGKLQTLLCSKDANGDWESMTASSFEIGERTYIVGTSAERGMILSLGNYPIRRMILFLAAGAVGVLFCIAAILIHRRYRNEQRFLTSQEEVKREHYAELFRMEQELKERRKQVKDYQLMDPLSLFYNREYFYTLLLNMKRQNLKSLGMIVIEMESMHKLIDRYGLEFEQETLQKIRDCLQVSITDENVIARVRDNRIVITMISDDYRLMSEECETLEKAIKALRLQIKTTVYSIIQMPNENAMDMYQRVDQIISIQ